MDNLRRLLEIMARLRDPDTGCSWNRRQDFASLIPYTLEEAYEVADAAERGDLDAIREELGDLLFQVVFHSRIAEERGLFAFEDVVGAIAEKLERRNPHIFSDAAFADDAERQRFWDEAKQAEKQAKGEAFVSILDGLTANLPALVLAQKLQKTAARQGFDWGDIEPVFAKLDEELAELRAACATGRIDEVQDEMGDVLFVMVNIARHLGVDAEAALRGTNRKFRRRFGFVEERLAERGKVPAESTLTEMDTLWDEAKRHERL